MPTGSMPPADRGAVTVEAALVLSSLTLVLTLAIGSIAAAAAFVRCGDAARELVRLAARGEPDRGRDIAARLAPAGAEVTLVIHGDEATAEVTAAPLRVLPVRISGRAVAVLEPGVAAAWGAPEPGGRTPDPPEGDLPQPGGARPDGARPDGARPDVARPDVPEPEAPP